MATTKRGGEKTAEKTTGKKRQKPGATGQGEYYHVEIRPAQQFTAFRTQDVGEKGGIQRVAGQRADGSWDTQKWLIGKDMAHLERGRLIADTADAREVLDGLGTVPVRVEGDRFRAHPDASG